MKSNKNLGFSMAELMIALAMIGIVATLTIANIGYSIQNKARLSEFKATYAHMETALKSTLDETGKIYGCYVCPDTTARKKYGLNFTYCNEETSGCTDFKNDFLKSLGVSRKCESNPIEEGCVPKNYPATGVEKCFNGNYKSGSAYVLDNSMILILEPTNNTFQTFAVDVNGKKGPNKWGQDIYTFSVTATDTYYDKSIGINEDNADTIKTITSNIARMPSPSTCLPGVSSEEDAKKRSTRSSEQMFEEMMNYN